MRLIIVATALVLVGTGAVSAGVGEEAFTLDLSVIPGGSTYFLKCSRSTELSDCGLITIWEQTNGHPGLQTSVLAYGDRPVQADNDLLP